MAAAYEEYSTLCCRRLGVIDFDTYLLTAARVAAVSAMLRIKSKGIGMDNCDAGCYALREV